MIPALTRVVGPPPPFPQHGDPTVEIWRDVDGAISAYGTGDGAECSMHLPGLATFRFRTDQTSAVEVAADPTTSDDTLTDAYHRTVLPMVLQARGREVLHASAALTPAGIIGLCAVSGTGKSTIAYGLAERGFPVWADDALALAVQGGRAEAVAVPFQLRLRPASASFFGANGSVSAMRRGGRTKELLALFVLERSERFATAHVERCTRADAFAAIFQHAYCFSFEHPERKRQMVENYMHLADLVPVSRIRFASGLSHLDEVLDAVTATVGLPPRGG